MRHLCCGIDIAKDTAVFSLLDHDGKPLSSPTTFKNTTPGFKVAIKWLRKLSKSFKPYDVHIAMEATSVYYLALSKFFNGQAGIIVSVVNPAQVHSFAGAELIRTKTDANDASVIARFAMAMHPRPWTPPAPHEEAMLSIISLVGWVEQSETQQF